MKTASPPRRHLFVCTNRRENSPLGPGCGERGDEVYDALKREVNRRGEVATTWITRTLCLGMCPASGTTVARYAGGPEETGRAMFTEATKADIDVLLAENGAAPADASEQLVHELDALEELQRTKVLDLARRLKPGLTMEDVQNPHDFPELDDPDWHYADGVLTGIQSVKSTLLALLHGARGRTDGDG